MKKILISSCLLGTPVRYNGKSEDLIHPIIENWKDQRRLVPVCPEVLAGLPTPRPPAEITDKSKNIIARLPGANVLSGVSKVYTDQHEDVTEAFVLGAEKTLEIALNHSVALAVFTEKSPSCGSSYVYDGTFKRQLREGQGVTVALLEEHGIKVFNQFELDLAQQYLENYGTSIAS